jgi:acyl-CoA thioester hydrolase
MAAESVFRARVRPRHRDAQGMMHASRYYEYFEDAFLHWLDENVGGYATLRAAGADLVVVASGCEHHRGAGLDDPVAIEVRPTTAGHSSLSVRFTMRREAEVLAVGHTTYVAVADGRSTPLPDRLRAAVSR